MDVSKILAHKRSKESPIKESDLLSSGSTLLNLNVSGSIHGLYAKGHYISVVGDSLSGKTWLVLTALAEACNNKAFDGYRLIYDDAEDGALMKLEKFFGKSVVQRIEPPSCGKDGDEMHSETIEDFYYHVDDALKKGEPFIYILDSMDALTSQYQNEKFQRNKDLIRTGKSASGSYGDGKAKKNSEHLRRVRAKIKNTKSILIIISQTRDNINPVSFETKTRSGGRALRFYAHVEFWTSTVSTQKKTVKGDRVKVSTKTRCRIKKNRLTGNECDVDLTILRNYGVDDIGDNIDYLVSHKVWKVVGKKIVAPEVEFKGTRSGLISHIEQNSLERDVQELVKDTWTDIQQASQPRRKPRYG